MSTNYYHTTAESRGQSLVPSTSPTSPGLIPEISHQPPHRRLAASLQPSEESPMAATPLLERSSRERIIESGPHVFRACRVSASMTDFSVGEPPAVGEGEGEASPYTMTVHIFFSRTYELRRMAGPLPAPLDEDDITTTPCEEVVLDLGLPPRELRSGGNVVRTMREILARVWLLKNLNLTEEEWDIIMPYDVMHLMWQ